MLKNIGKKGLEQLIMIFNQDLENDEVSMLEFEEDDDAGYHSLLFSELMAADMHSFKNLYYFEFSIYNDTTMPSFSAN